MSERPDDLPTPGEAPGEGGPGGPAPGSGEGRSIARAGFATLATSLLLHLATPLGLLDALLLGGLLVLLPALAVVQLRMLGAVPLDRPSIYLGSGLTILLLGATSLAVGARRLGWEGMGLGAFPLPDFLAWTGGLTATGLLLIGVFHWVGRRFGLDESGVLEQLLPETRREKALFAALSFAAGIGEELAYRAYAITTIALALSPMWSPGGAPPPELAAGAAAGAGLWVSAGLAAAAFGFLHAYQGTIGIIRTALLGFVLAVSFLITGSLWPAVAAHTLIDLVAGLVIGRHLVHPGNDHGD